MSRWPWIIKVVQSDGKTILLTNIKPFPTRKLAREYINNRLARYKGLKIIPIKVKITTTYVEQK